ncbi:MAG: hypothetical protein ACRETD_03835, partial [Steroidobacteraceae bacterium]
MSRCILFLLALTTLPAFAQSLAPTPSAPLSPEMPPAQRLAQFHHDEINLLALRADAHSLLAAALMAQTDANDPTRPAVLKSPALLARAQKTDDADALVWWVSAALECGGKAKVCPAEATLAQLEKFDPGNAAAWLWALHRAQQAGNAVSARAALISAAQATRFDDQFGALTALVYRATAILPVDEAILRASNQPGVGQAGFRLTYAAGVAIAVPQAYRDSLSAACTNASADPGLATDCIAVAQRMADSGSLAARGFGAQLLLSLLPASAEHDSAVAQARALAWRLQSIGGLADR